MEYILLTGHRKSGTTLLHKLFDGHPRLNIYPVDFTFLYAYFPCFSNVASRDEAFSRIRLILDKSLKQINGTKIPKSDNVFQVERFIDFAVSRLSESALVNRAEFIEAFSNAWCDFNSLDKSLPFLIKETSQTIHLTDIRKNSNKVNVVQIIRDPRDNYAAIAAGISNYYSKMGENKMEVLASVINRARLDLLTASQMSRQEPKTFMAVRFEDLVGDTESVMRSVADFLAIDWSDSLLTPTFLEKDYFGNSHENNRMSGVFSGNSGRWRERISEEDAQIIEFWTQDAMHSWGYELEYSLAERHKSFSKFYDWYNCRYFYRDSFKI